MMGVSRCKMRCKDSSKLHNGHFKIMYLFNLKTVDISTAFAGGQTCDKPRHSNGYEVYVT